MRHALLLAAVTAFAAWGVPSLTPAAWAQETTAEDAVPDEAPSTDEAAPAEEAPADEAAVTPLEDSASSDNAATDEATEAAATIPDMALGEADAPVTIIEYGSFTCPHCANWHAEVWPRLKADYIDTGKVRFIFREIYFDRPGLWASMIARCGGEMRFFGIHDMLYEQQREWIGDMEPATIADNLRRLGLSAGLDQAQLDACLTDAAQAEALVAWFQANATADEVQGTPTFLINGESHSGEMAYEDFKGLVDAALEQAGQ
jgi:protein-disulfide isomerase